MPKTPLVGSHKWAVNEDGTLEAYGQPAGVQPGGEMGLHAEGQTSGHPLLLKVNKVSVKWMAWAATTV